MHIHRMIDANINRVSEGIRVLEDLARFILEKPNVTEQLRSLRHEVRKGFQPKALIVERDASNDIGYNIASNNCLDQKENLDQLITANFKRIQEGLRSVEESLKIIGDYQTSKYYESLRYRAYTIEKQFVIGRVIIRTDLYGITGEAYSLGRDNITVVKAMLEAGVKIIQYREKNKNKREKFKECLALKKLTKAFDAQLIVNDDVDIAIAVDADGIHIGQEDLPVKEVRKIVGQMLIGCSTHNEKQAIKAVEDGADYIGVGPIFKTTTKKNVEASEGLKYLRWVSKNIKLPYVAIGGINISNITLAKVTGGSCFAMISEIVGAKDISQKVKEIRDVLNKCVVY